MSKGQTPMGGSFVTRLVLALTLVVLVSCLSDASSQHSGITDGVDGGEDAGSAVAGGFGGGGTSVSTAGGFAPSGGGMASTCGMRAAGGADYRVGSEFLTSASMNGAFGGVAEAMDRCNLAARGAGLERIYQPWVTADAVWPGDGFYSRSDDGPDGFISPACLPDEFFCARRSDERGVLSTASAWTGFTTPCVAAPNCAGWTSATSTAQGITEGGLVGCQERHRLLCRAFNGRRPVLTIDGGQPQRISFVTRERFSGALGGVAGADTRCQQVARDAGLTGDYRAFLGTSTLPAPSRFRDGGLWGPRGSTEIAFLNDATLSTTPRRALSEDETGARLADEEPIWTGTEPWAVSTGSDCAQWTNTSGLGTHGATGHLDEAWVLRGTLACSQTAHLLCLEN